MPQLLKVDREIIHDTVRRNIRQRRERSTLMLQDVAKHIGTIWPRFPSFWSCKVYAFRQI